MELESLEEKKQFIVKHFDEVNITKAEAEDELKRLQGEYRIVEEMIEIVKNRPERLRKEKKVKTTDAPD